jgi:GAF domain-containing protein
MKRAAHKLKIGSKSIVGYVTGIGEPLVVNDTSRDATYFANPLLPETRAEVAIPLKVGQRILGALDVQSTQPYSFGEEDVSVLRILADQMAIAVINSELFADTQEHLSQHRLLHHVTTAAASGTTIEESLNSAAQGLQVTLGGDRVSILLADKESKKLKVKAFAGYSEDVEQLEIPFGEGITGWVAIHQQPQRVNDVTEDPRYIQVGSNIRSELAIPLNYRGELLGVLNVESDQVGAYNENDEELLGTLGGSLAAVISNARLLEQVRRQVDRERMLYEVTSKIRRSTDMQTIMATTTSELSKVLGAHRAQIKIDIGEDPKNQPTSDSD